MGLTLTIGALAPGEKSRDALTLAAEILRQSVEHVPEGFDPEVAQRIQCIANALKEAGAAAAQATGKGKPAEAVCQPCEKCYTVAILHSHHDPGTGLTMRLCCRCAVQVYGGERGCYVCYQIDNERQAKGKYIVLPVAYGRQAGKTQLTQMLSAAEQFNRDMDAIPAKTARESLHSKSAILDLIPKKP